MTNFPEKQFSGFIFLTFSNNGYTTDYIYPRRIDESKPTLKSNYFAFDIFWL